MRDLPTYAEVANYLSYCPETGRFTRIDTPRGRGFRQSLIGIEAGGIGVNGYVHIGVSGGRYLAHRLAWLLMNKTWPMFPLDHIDGNRANNKWENLRECCGEIRNSHNITATRSDNASGVTGVSLCNYTNKWKAYVTIDGRQKNLGRFSSVAEAELAVKAARAANYPASKEASMARSAK